MTKTNEEPANLTITEIDALESCRSGAGGVYPPDWWPVMKLSGRMDRILARFGESSDLKAFAIDRDGSRRPL